MPSKVVCDRPPLPGLVAVLSDGRNVVVKARPFEPLTLGCVALRRSLAADGLPYRTPLAGSDLVNRLPVSAETLVGVGVQRDVAAGADLFAALLARRVAAVPAPDVVPVARPVSCIRRREWRLTARMGRGDHR
jgi:hypothetical protein